jgi:hypothetical protein
MKNEFSGFYSPTDEQLNSAWHADDTLFVFDTNTLLNLYSYAEQTRNDFFKILDNIEAKIWIPHQVALEYQMRRLSIIRNEKDIFSKINKHLVKIDDVLTKDFKQLSLDKRLPTLHTKTDKFHSDLKKLISSYRRSVTTLDNKQPNVRSHDKIRDRIDELFTDKVGSKPTEQKWLDDLYKDGKVRYENKMPPGYKDANKSKQSNNKFQFSGLSFQREYGDLILWKQLLEHAKMNEGIKSVIFISDDAKEDWWYIIDAQGEKTIGPRAELRQEICEESDIDLFTILNTSDFLKSGKNLLNIDVNEMSVTEALDTFSENLNKSEVISHNQALAQALTKYEELDNIKSTNYDDIFSNKVRNYLIHSSPSDNKWNKAESNLFADYFKDMDKFKPVDYARIIELIKKLKENDESKGSDKE